MKTAIQYSIPSDYRSLWQRMLKRLEAMKVEDALRLAGLRDADEKELRILQGRCEAYDQVRAEMAMMLETERVEKRGHNL